MNFNTSIVLRSAAALLTAALLLTGCERGPAGGAGGATANGTSTATNVRQPSRDRTLLHINDAEPPRPTRSLYDACIYGDVNEVKSNLFWGASPNEAAADGFMPLHGAGRNNYPEIVELLLEFGANPNYVVRPQQQNVDPLIWAARSGCFECVKLLVEFGADVNRKGGVPPGMTPLELATTKGFREIAEYLMLHGAKP